MPIGSQMVLARSRRRFERRPVALLACALVGAALFASTGWGATSGTVTPNATVLGTLALTAPTALSTAPTVCGNAVAPLDTDDCTDVTFTGGSTPVLTLGSLAGSDVQAGALTWHVTTTNPSGYRLVMENAGAAPVLRSSSSSISDLSAVTLTAADALDDTTGFGVAMGNATDDDEGAVAYSGSPWIGAGGAQGELYSGIPVSGVLVAQRTGPRSNDAITASFAASSVVGSQPDPGSYSGTVRVTASAL